MTQLIGRAALCAVIVAVSSIAVVSQSIEETSEALTAIESLAQRPTDPGSWETRLSLFLWIRKNPDVCVERLIEKDCQEAARVNIPVCEELLGPPAGPHAKGDPVLLLDSAFASVGYALKHPGEAHDYERLAIVGLRAALNVYATERDAAIRGPDGHYEWLMGLDDEGLQEYVREVLYSCFGT